MGIFWVLLLLMAAVDINQLLFPSGRKGIVHEKEREEVIQRLKEQEASLQLQCLSLKKKITDLEARQELLTNSVLALERKIQQRTCKVLFLAAIRLLRFWRQHLQEVTCQHSGEGETDTCS